MFLAKFTHMLNSVVPPKAKQGRKDSHTFTRGRAGVNRWGMLEQAHAWLIRGTLKDQKRRLKPSRKFRDIPLFSRLSTYCVLKEIRTLVLD